MCILIGVEVNEVVLCVLAGGFSAVFIFSKYSRILSCKVCQGNLYQERKTPHNTKCY